MAKKSGLECMGALPIKSYSHVAIVAKHSKSRGIMVSAKPKGQTIASKFFAFRPAVIDMVDS